MKRVDFSPYVKGLSPFHDTATTFIGVTGDADGALAALVKNVAIMRIGADKWPKEIRPLKGVRFVLKESGCRNFLVVSNQGATA